MIQLVEKLLERVTMSCLGSDFKFRVEYDNEFGEVPFAARIFIQIVYEAPCTKTGEISEWRGRKWYLSKHMTNDEIIKTAYAAFQAAILHEVMEGFKVDGKILFNPHINFEELLGISDCEIKRQI